MSKKIIIVLLSVCLLLITTISLVVFNIVYDAGHIYIGEIKIENQGQYHSFLDAIFVTGVTVAVLDIQPSGEDIPIYKESLWVDYPKLPVIIGFNLRSVRNPIVNLVGVKIYNNENGNPYDDTTELYDKTVYSVCMAMVGYGLTFGIWISRNGIYEVRKITQSTQKATLGKAVTRSAQEGKG